MVDKNSLLKSGKASHQPPVDRGSNKSTYILVHAACMYIGE